MSESGGITASSLAITEKKPQRSGGCVGIFFQLFDWNRRFAKKKLFPKKLIPPVRLKQGSKKFGGDEKQPKLRLIADENSGGFPNLIKSNSKACSVYSEKKQEMRSPGLVARLMGLDSMPSVSRDNKPKKVSFNGSEADREESEELRGAKQELRPQKLQKTGLSERRPVTRFGAEALQIKSMLSRSRKHHHHHHHHPKLVSPVKSPRNPSSRLIGMATKILEPGMQKSRYALTCSEALLRRPPEVLQDPMALAPENSEYSSYYAGSPDAVKGTCKNCGHSLEIPNQEPVIPSPVSSYIEPCQDSERSVPRMPMFFSMEQKEAEGGRLEKKPINRGQMQQHLTSQECQLPHHGSSRGSLRRTQKLQRNQMFLGRDRVPIRARSTSLHSKANSINETKNFIALNKSLNGGGSSSSTRMKMPIKPDSSNFEMERRFCNRRTESLSPVRKRRSMNVARQGKSSEFTNFNLGKELSGKETLHPARSTTRKFPCPPESYQNGSRQKGSDIVSFTFKSPVKHGEATGKGFHDSTQEKSVSKENNFSPFALRGDALGLILEQKLKELTCQEVELAEGGPGTTPRKTTAVILQELISALTTESQFREDDFVVRSNRKSTHHEDTSTKFKAAAKSTAISATYNQDINHFSPGSVLEGPFSNNSCLSSSLDGNSIPGDKLSAESMCFFHDESCSFDPDADLLDSATSLATGKCYNKPLISDLANNVTEVLQKIDLYCGHLKGSKLGYAKEVILNAELVLGNGSSLDGSFSITHFLLEKLETLTSVILMRLPDLLAFENGKNQLKRFIFDYVLEFLDSKVSRHSTKLPTFGNTETLVFEILEDAKLRTAMAGLIIDERIEWDMSHSLGKWTDFEIEVFENGAEIDGEILQNLVDEAVMELCTVV